MQYVVILTILIFVINLYFKIAVYFNIIDKPNKRSSHASVTLRGGGVIFYFAALAYFIISGFSYPYFFIGLSLVTIISFLDDVFTLSNKLRLLIQLISMAFMFYQLEFFDLHIAFIIIAFVICMGTINAYNFMDGINGITGVYSLSVFFGLWLINNFHIYFIDNDFIYCSVLALLVFNFYNFRKKAKCFAGDVGAVTISFIILFLIGKLLLVEPTFSVILLLAVYGIDSVLTIIHRLILNENIFVAHRKHLYQILSNEAKVPQLYVSIFYGIIQIMINFILLFLLHFQFSDIISAVIVSLVFIIMSITYVFVKKKYFHLHQLV